MVKKTTKAVSAGPTCGSCGGCTWFTIIAGIILIAIGWSYIAIPWAKWVTIIIGVLLILKKWCPCQKR